MSSMNIGCFSRNGDRKKSYPTIADALYAARASAAYTGSEPDVYECGDCNSWHLTARRSS